MQLLYQQPCPSLSVLSFAWRLNENYHYLFLTDHLSSLNMLDDLTLIFFPALFKCEPLACRRRYFPDEAVCVCSPPRSASVDLLSSETGVRSSDNVLSFLLTHWCLLSDSGVVLSEQFCLFLRREIVAFRAAKGSQVCQAWPG